MGVKVTRKEEVIKETWPRAIVLHSEGGGGEKEYPQLIVRAQDGGPGGPWFSFVVRLQSADGKVEYNKAVFVHEAEAIEFVHAVENFIHTAVDPKSKGKCLGPML